VRELLQDVRYGARVLVRQPGFTSVVAVTLALAIGANTVIFSIASFLLLRPLPFKDHATLVAVSAIDPQRGNDRERTSHADFLEWRAEAQSFEAIGAFTGETYTMTGRGEPTRLMAEQVTANLFDVWKVDVVRGRGFQPGEDLPGAEPVVVLSHGFWTRQFASDSDVLGRTLTLDGRAHSIVGVLTPEMEIGNLSEIDVWTPITLDPDQPRDDRRLTAYARLKPGVTSEMASVEMATIAQRQARDHPVTNDGWSAHTMPLLRAMTGPNAWLVLALLGLVVSLVLVIACANVANLMLARAVSRQKELAVRSAIGAGRLRLVRQLMTESLLLGLAGGGLGLLLARGGLAVIKAVSYEPFFHQIEVDFRVLTLTAILSLVTPLLFGLLPAMHAARMNLNQALLEGAGRTSGGVRGRRSRGALVVAQLSLAVALLVLSTLVVRTAIAQARLDVGFETDRVLTLQLELEGQRYADLDAVRRFYDDVIARLGALPGVDHAAVAHALPVFSRFVPTPFEIEGRPPVSELADRPWGLRVTASPAYFEAFDIPVRRGRGFRESDGPDAPGVVVISAEAERRYWRDDDPVGRRIRLRDDGPWLEIVGVVEDVYNRQQLVEGYDPQFYLPASQHPNRAMAFAIRTSADPEALVPAVRREIRAADPDQAVYDVKTMAQTFREALSSDRLLFGMFVSFALLALVLASGGLYGLMSYSVAQRGREFGVRMALGARGGDVVRQVVWQGLVLAATGVGLGLLGGFGLAHAVAAMLFGVGPNDPTTYVGVAAALLAVALLASYLPARRAVAIDPLTALR